MTTYYLTPITTILQYFTDSGIVLNGGKIYTYLAGTSTPQTTKTDSTGAVNNSNPITLNAAGRLNNVNIWQAQGVKLKLIIQDASGNQIGPALDQIAGINDPTDLLATLALPATGSGADLVANAVVSFDLIASVRAAGAPALAGGQTRVINVQAGTSPNDGLSGMFYWNATSTATDDGVNTIKPTGVSGAGRYSREINLSSQTGSFTATLTGMTATVTGSINYSINGTLITLFAASAITGTSNAATMTMTGFSGLGIMPPSLSATRIVPSMVEDNGVVKSGGLEISPTSLVFEQTLGTAGGFANVGTKGLPAGTCIIYDRSLSLPP